MQEILPTYGIEFEVWYMSKTESNRKWILNNEDFKYKYRFFGNSPFRIGRIFIHFNLFLIFKFIVCKRDISIIGGAYSSPNHIILSLIGRKSKKVLWSEGNIQSTQKKTGFILELKKFLTRNYCKYIVPGIKGEELISFLNGKVNKLDFIRLPNLIDKNQFYINARNQNDIDLIKKKFGISNNKQVWFSPARLSPEKGLIEFVVHLKGISNVEYIIAGDGPLLSEIQELIKDLSLPVRLLGNQQMHEIVELYRCSDVFILPSFWDSSPLSAIEAIAAGLPILISNKIGNFPEVLIENYNGWSFTPSQNFSSTTQLLVQKIANMSKEELANIGRKSNDVYNKNFDNVASINNFANEINKIILK